METMKRELVEDITWVARVAADVTQEAGLAMRPMTEGPVLEAVSLVPLGGRRVLALIVTTDGTVEKRVLDRTDEVTALQLQQEANFINRMFGGLPIEVIRSQVSQTTDAASATADAAASAPASGLPDAPASIAEDASASGVKDAAEARATAMIRYLCDEAVGESEVEVVGTDRLLHSEDFAEAERIRSLLTTLQDRRRIVREWRRALTLGRTQVLIGRESELTASGNLGMVATLYYREGRRAGALGVVGPRRMDYGRIVPLVEFMGDTLTRMLNEPGATHA
jgi:heat-inducible transcriptional repressor